MRKLEIGDVVFLPTTTLVGMTVILIESVDNYARVVWLDPGLNIHSYDFPIKALRMYQDGEIVRPD
jgi:hypothetical protein